MTNGTLKNETPENFVPKTLRVSTITAVTSPLGFLVLAFLAVEGLLTILVLRSTTKPEPLLWTMVVALILLIAVVVLLATWRPEALSGVRPLSAHYAILFSDNLTLALEGPFSNLGGVDEDEAWLMLSGVLNEVEGESVDREYVDFCQAVSERLRRRADQRGRWRKAKGPIER